METSYPCFHEIQRFLRRDLSILSQVAFVANQQDIQSSVINVYLFSRCQQTSFAINAVDKPRALVEGPPGRYGKHEYKGLGASNPLHRKMTAGNSYISAHGRKFLLTRSV